MVLSYKSGEITAKIKGGSRVIVRDVDFDIEEGERLALIGETGAGKTMIAQSIMRLLPENVRQTGGSMVFCGVDLSDLKTVRKILGKEIAYIPQSGADCLNPTRKVKYHLYDSLKRMGLKGDALKAACIDNLVKAGFEDAAAILNLYPFQLSGGMAQRVTIALALCSHAKLIICDEATNGLNYVDKTVFVKRISELFPSAAKLFITHDMQVAGACDRIGVLCSGRLVESGEAAIVSTAPKHPYTQSLLSALAKNGMKQTPVLRKNEGDCPFYPRCEIACEECKGEIPRIEEGGHMRRCAL